MEARKMELEKQSPPARRYLTAFAVLVAVTFGFCGFTYVLFSPLTKLASGQHGSKSLAPILRQVESSSRIADFQEHAHFKSLDHIYDTFWDEMLLPSNGGYVTSSSTSNNTDKLGISMFHQLHCLSMIRDEMQLLKDSLDSMKGPSHAKGEHAQDVQVHRRHGHMHEDDGSGPGEHEHALHCFDYLRQVSHIGRGLWNRISDVHGLIFLFFFAHTDFTVPRRRHNREAKAGPGGKALHQWRRREKMQELGAAVSGIYRVGRQAVFYRRFTMSLNPRQEWESGKRCIVCLAEHNIDQQCGVAFFIYLFIHSYPCFCFAVF